MAEDQNRSYQDKFMLRLPEGMREDIKATADLLNRSMNSEIVQRLKRSFEEDRDERLKLDLPGDVWNSLMADAAIHDMRMEDRATQILAKAYNPKEGHTLALEKLMSVSSEMSDMAELITHLKEKEDADFLLYYNKIVQIRQFVTILLQAGVSLPALIAQSASELAEITHAELNMLKARREDAALREKLAKPDLRDQQEFDQSTDEF